jgi:hypothetical protein
MIMVFLGMALLFFLVVMYFGWIGKIGLIAIGCLAVAFFLFFVGRKKLDNKVTRQRITQIAKLLFTIAGILVLLRHPIETGIVDAPTDQQITVQIDWNQDQAKDVTLKFRNIQDQSTKEFSQLLQPGKNDIQIDLQAGQYMMVAEKDIQPLSKKPIYTAISVYITTVDNTTFFTYALLAMLIKFIGVLSSALAWHLLLVGQGIVFPYWQTTVTSFLIGRFIGTFLPSTIGLDGYTLYEAGTYSNQWHRVITAKGLEKFVGITGLFLGMLLTLPFGYSVLQDVTQKFPSLPAPEVQAFIIGGIAGSVSLVVILGLVKPTILSWLLSVVGQFMPKKIQSQVNKFTTAVTAYRGKVGLLFLVLLNKFVTHFTTAVVYFFTALAIGVSTASFWPIVFGSNIQILGTLFSPTIAGEGVREAIQALLLDKQLGGVAQAVLSGALGFIAAEAATMWGGAFLWTRTPSWRPTYCLVDGEQVSYEWITEQEEFSAERLVEIRQEHQDSSSQKKM